MNICAFDDLAASYDESFTRTAVGQALRAMVWARLGNTFRATQRILELGCGTGEDALWLGRNGIEVLATDSSSRMIEVANQKLAYGDYGARVVFQCLPMENLEKLPGEPPFDGSFSNFGAVNCVADLPKLIAEIARRLVPGARLVWVVMGRHVPWEWIWFLARGEPSKAMRRYSRRGSEWRGLKIAYPTPKQMVAILTPHFEVLRVSPLGLALPPTYASGWLNDWPGALKALTRLETLAHDCASLAGVADHYIVEAQVRAAA